MQTVIFATGTSVLAGLATRVQLRPGNEAAQLTRDLVGTLGASTSAEAATLDALRVGPGDRVVFCATDSPNGLQAARVNEIVALQMFQCDAVVQTVAGLRLDNADAFRREGLPALVSLIDREVDAAKIAGSDVVVSAGTGIKPLVPYLAIYSMLRGVTLCYLFEDPPVLVRLPRLPLAFNVEALRAAMPVLVEIDDQTVVSIHRVRAALGDDLPVLEGLFEEVDENQVTLSPFGHLVLSSIRTAASADVYLSPSAAAALNAADGIARAQFEMMLERCRNPLWRDEKRHAFSGTDLEVYKPGSTAQRMAAWVGSGNVIYVAELYSDHNAYERHLPGRRRKDYASPSFVRWHPPVVDGLAPEESEGDLLIRLVERERANATRMVEESKRQVDEAITMAATVESTLRAQLSTVERALAESERVRPLVCRAGDCSPTVRCPTARSNRSVLAPAAAASRLERCQSVYLTELRLPRRG